MAVKTYKLNITKSDGTSENVSFTIPDSVGIYNIKFTLSDGQEIDAGNIIVDDTEHTYNLKLTLSDGSTINAGTITTPIAMPTFGEMSWDKIAEISESGSASTRFAVGDEKTIELSTGEQITVVILGFDHDMLSEGAGNAGITIGMKNLLRTPYVMNGINVNDRGWIGSEMLNSTMPKLFSQLPNDLKRVIKEVIKKSTAGNSGTSITTSSNKLWLLSLVEIDGNNLAGYRDEGKQYEYWKTVKDGTVMANRIKYINISEPTPFDWWLRSASITSDTEYKFVNYNGEDLDGMARTSKGVSFCFCV